MKSMIALMATATFAFASLAHAVENKAMAPDFSLKATTGKNVRLSDYLGKTVVLEWTNPGCPFVQKHYSSKNMQALQKKYTDKGVIWLTVASSAPGKQGHLDAKSGSAFLKDQGAAPATLLLLDEKGTVGKLYKAETTPHMFVVNSKGRLVYQGAIDDKPSADVEDIKGARNYVADALDATLADKEVKDFQTKSYGCSVKY